MVQLMLNRRRRFQLLGLSTSEKWEQYSTFLNILGGVLFVIGSVFFIPFETINLFDPGCWLYFAGCVLYVMVGVHDVYEQAASRKYVKNDVWYVLEVLAAVSNLCGTTTYLIGSIFFLSYVDLGLAGGWSFTIGSIFLIVGSTINLLHVGTLEKKSLIVLQNLCTLQQLLAALFFFFPSVFYLPRSKPRSCPDGDVPDEILVEDWQAALYLVGSVLFLTTSITNLQRQQIFQLYDLQKTPSDDEPPMQEEQQRLLSEQ